MAATAHVDAWTPGGTREEESSREDVTLFLAALSFLVGLVHVQAAIFHGGDAWSHAAFFVALALFQMAWPVWLYRDPSRTALLAGGGVSAMVICVWIASRTVGAPGGPHPWQPEAVELGDAAASMGELVILLLVAAVLRNGTWPELGGRAQFAIAMVLAFTATAIAFGGH